MIFIEYGHHISLKAVSDKLIALATDDMKEARVRNGFSSTFYRGEDINPSFPVTFYPSARQIWSDAAASCGAVQKFMIRMKRKRIRPFFTGPTKTWGPIFRSSYH